MSKIVYSIGLIINVRERKVHANFDVENESSREQKLQRTKVPPMELSLSGTKVLGYESSSYHDDIWGNLPQGPMDKTVKNFSN